MWLRVPKDMERALWEGALEPESATARTVEQRTAGWAARTGGDRYVQTRELPDLEKGIHNFQRAVELTPPGSPDLPMYLSDLAVGLWERYARIGELPDLEKGIHNFQRAVELTPPGSPDLPMYLNNLGLGLRERYARIGELPDLEKGIHNFQRAVELTPEGSPHLPALLNNLGNGLSERYARTGELPDLEKGIDSHERAVELTPEGSPDLPTHLNNLGNGLRNRYERTGDVSDLERAIRAFEQAVEKIPPGSPDLVTYLGNLSLGLGARYERTGDVSDLEGSIRQMPTVSIGQPEVWQLTTVYPPRKMPSILRAKLEEADFYLVRLACSFRPGRDDVKIERARFMAHLIPDETGQQPVAFDLHPLQVTQEMRRNVKVTLAPTLKFMEVEAGVGEVEFGLEYPELQPVITAAGAGEASPSWDYEEARGVRIQGSKWMHLLVKAPKGMPSGFAILDLFANVTLRGAPLRMLVLRNRREAEARLTAQLWG